MNIKQEWENDPAISLLLAQPSFQPFLSHRKENKAFEALYEIIFKATLNSFVENKGYEYSPICLRSIKVPLIAWCYSIAILYLF